MKKILILLIGFAFTQSIQTKQVEVTITDWSDINLYDLLDNPIEGNYDVKISGYQLNNSSLTDVEICNMSAEFSIYPSHYTEEPMHYSAVSLCGNQFGFGHIPILNSGNDYINIDYPSLIISAGEPFSMSITLTFWITGMFSDNLDSSTDIDELQTQIDDLTAQVNDLVSQLTGCVDCQGDASANGMVNVQDIILLVEHILEVEDGDCYTD